MLIIYNKTTGEIVNNQGKISIYPNGILDPKPILQLVIEEFGGTEQDYGIFRLHDKSDCEIVNKTFTHDFTIENGNVVFGEERVFEELPRDPTETEVLTDYLVDVDYRLTLVELGLV